jgi:hypothetical protein
MELSLLDCCSLEGSLDLQVNILLASKKIADMRALTAIFEDYIFVKVFWQCARNGWCTVRFPPLLLLW